MKKLLLLGVLLTGWAGAAGWEYGFLSEENGKIFWKPGSEKAVLADANKYGDLLSTLKCKATTNNLPHTTSLPQLDFFNCVGAQGWEYVGLKYLNSQSVTYIFKRPLK